MEMRVNATGIEGLFLLDLEVRADEERPGGSFREVFHSRRFLELGLPPFEPVQWNISESTEGTVRGFHAEPWNKLIHVATGRAFAAIADLRAGSATAGRVWTGELDRTRALFVGAGLGNGFQVVSDVAVYAYLVDAHWSADASYPAVAWDDPDLAVTWPITDDRLSLSTKDRTNPTLRAHWER
ncbi:MAG: dTDP-4-dehydrorhamnose 3,5-epimerase [Actinomycetota bacterium]